MATVNFTRDEINGRAHSAIWLNMSETDNDGERYTLPGGSDRSVQVTGTFGGATLSIQGSNLQEPTTADTDWVNLNDTNGTAVSFTAAGLSAILENTRWIRPRLTGGTSADINVYLVSKAN